MGTTPHHRPWLSVVAVIAAVLLAGCGPKEPRRMAVRGAVTYQGKPLAAGTIDFVPLDMARGFMAGATIEGGRYSVAAREGLLPGTYRVQISAAAPAGGRPRTDRTPGAIFQAPELLPARYNTASTLTATVTADGPNEFDFPLD